MTTDTHTPARPLAGLAFTLLIILFSPVVILGYVLWVGKLMIAGTSSGVSGTAQGPLSARWFQHQLGTRPDEPANRLMPLLPNLSPLGLRLSSWPLLLAHRLTGFVPRAFRYPYQGEVAQSEEASARQTFFDELVERHLPAITQFVILGAGFDTRAYRLPAGWGVRCFEIDAPKTQAVKRDLLVRAAIDTSHVAFVSADFETDDWLARLVEAGFDVNKPALFIWEGVTMYLERPAIEATLRKIGGLANGTILAFDFFTTEPLTSQSLYWRYGRAMTRAANEPLVFGVDSTPPMRDRLAELLASCGLALVEARTLGQETDGNRAWGGFATAIVK